MNKSFINPSEYIYPNLRENKSSSISNYINALPNQGNPYFQETLKFDSLLKKQKLFIIGEPGFGKSRLMRQLFEEFEKKKHKCCFIDLKDVKDEKTNLESYINQKLKKKTKIVSNHLGGSRVMINCIIFM